MIFMKIYWLGIVTISFLLSGCSSTYYAALEKVGIEKRDILVDRVEDAQDAQEDTKEEFQSTLEEFSSLVNYQGGSLEKIYKRMKGKFEDSESAAKSVSSHIKDIERVGADLFDEWRDEIKLYSSASLRRKSEQSLGSTKRNYELMLDKMYEAEEKMYPILDLFRDQVLYLKHNLNAEVVASLQAEVNHIEEEVRELILEMEASISEAETFIKTMTAKS